MANKSSKFIQTGPNDGGSSRGKLKKNRRRFWNRTNKRRECLHCVFLWLLIIQIPKTVVNINFIYDFNSISNHFSFYMKKGVVQVPRGLKVGVRGTHGYLGSNSS